MEKELNIWKKDFRKSKEWKEKRENLIKERGEKCEWGTSKEFLTPAHKDHLCKMMVDLKGKKFSFFLIISNSQLRTNYYSIFKAYLNQILVKEIPDSYFKKKKDGTRFKSGKLTREAWEFLYNNEEIKKLLSPVVEKVNDYFKKWYMDFNNCLLLCRRCHFAQGEGQLLCECKEKYYFIRHGSCPDCYSDEKKEEIAKRRADREKEEMEEKEEYEKIVKWERELFKRPN